MQIQQAHEVLSQCAGFKQGEFGQNVDDPNLWVLMTQWENIGSYRRALGSMAVKMEAVPLLARAIDEPGAFDSNLYK